MKKLITTIVVFISIFGLVIFFWVKDNNDLVNKQTLLPRFSIPDLPSGKVGEYYEAELTGLLIGAKAELEIVDLQIPVWLNIDDCKQEYNVSNLPQPNSLITCQLTGYPNESGTFNSSFEINAEGYFNKTIQNFELYINQ